MNWRKKLQGNNPSEDILEKLESEIMAIERELMDLQLQKHQKERWLEDYLSNYYVLAAKDESFEDHLATVHYANGYYESLEAALKDSSELAGGWIIYDLNGKIVQRS